MPIDRLADVKDTDRQTLSLQAEAVTVAKRVRKVSVRATTTTATRDVLVEEDLAREHVIVERVAIGRVVDEAPPVRREGDVTILPVVEEEIVITRRLILREEIRFRRVHTTHRHVETVTLREQRVAVTRTALADETTDSHPAVRTTP